MAGIENLPLRRHPARKRAAHVGLRRCCFVPVTDGHSGPFIWLQYRMGAVGKGQLNAKCGNIRESFPKKFPQITCVLMRHLSN